MTVPEMHMLSSVKSKEELPEPEAGLMAFDVTHSVDGRTYFWFAEKGEWVLKEVVAPVCPYCGK